MKLLISATILFLVSTLCHAQFNPGSTYVCVSDIQLKRDALFDEITALESQAMELANQGQDNLAGQRALEAVQLAREAVELRRAEDFIRSQYSIGQANSARCIELNDSVIARSPILGRLEEL